MEIYRLKKDNEQLQEGLRRSVQQTGPSLTAEIQHKDNQLKESSSVFSPPRIVSGKIDHQAGGKRDTNYN